MWAACHYCVVNGQIVNYGQLVGRWTRANPILPVLNLNLFQFLPNAATAWRFP